ncbi:MAG: serine/threonine protein kinase, partial [Spirulina sp.]
LRQARDWKTLELFEREARVLENLNHPFIPNYIDYFQLETRGDTNFYLVQELVEGECLARLLERGWHPKEKEVKDIAIQILEILTYLQELNPPVIHRDIKPQNIIRRQDGVVYLVDFGTVQNVFRNSKSFASTFVGTMGYIPIEQLRGQASFASDLYSLGATLIYLLTRQEPSELPKKNLKIDFKSRVKISSVFKNWLDRLVEPLPEDRFSSAREALSLLKQGKLNGSHKKDSFKKSILLNQKPELNERVQFMKNKQTLIIKINYNPVSLLCLLWALSILVKMWENDYVSSFSQILFHLFWAGFLLYNFYALCQKTYLEINRNECIIKWIDLFVFTKTIRFRTEDIADITYQAQKCLIWKGMHSYRFIDDNHLESKDIKWIAAQIQNFLKEIK